MTTDVGPHLDKQVTVFLVDDNAAVLSSIQGLLELGGYIVHPALNKQKVMSLLEAGYRPDVLMADFHLPGASGIDIIKQVRAWMGDPLPSIIMSGDTSAREIQESKLKRFAVLQKPSRSETMFQLINQVIASEAG
jgi:two-component system, sensor histidine kinase